MPNTRLDMVKSTDMLTTERLKELLHYNPQTGEFHWLAGRQGVRNIACEAGDINGVRSDNRWANLRMVSRSVNNQNQRRARKDNKSGLLGVRPNRARWAASIFVYGKKHHLGTYDTAEEAHAVYIKAKRGLHVGNQL